MAEWVSVLCDREVKLIDCVVKVCHFFMGFLSIRCWVNQVKICPYDCRLYISPSNYVNFYFLFIWKNAHDILWPKKKRLSCSNSCVCVFVCENWPIKEHGFRFSLRDWAAKLSFFAHEFCDLKLSKPWFHKLWHRADVVFHLQFANMLRFPLSSVSHFEPTAPPVTLLFFHDSC